MNTIKNEVKNEIIINKSIFICLICPVQSATEAKAFLESVKNRYPDATHYPAAYIIGNSGESGHASDDGEPGRTAGAPMFEILRKNALTNVIAVVVRYFGGIKLGAGGLIRAYAKSVSEALKLTTPVPIVEYRRLRLIFDYPVLSLIENALNSLKILNRTFAGNCIFDVELPASDVLLFKQMLASLAQGNIFFQEIVPKDPETDED